MLWSTKFTITHAICMLLLSGCIKAASDSDKLKDSPDSDARPDSEGDSGAGKDSGVQESGGSDSEATDSGATDDSDSSSTDDSDSQPPASEEVCDGVDNDHDGSVDEDAEDALTWYLDRDGDGHGESRYFVMACEAPDGYSAYADDCDPKDSTRYPGAAEDCSTDSDLDCDGLPDCADGDCAGDAACAEDCTNGSDDNRDGYADCLDDECWAVCDTTVRSHLRGGSISYSSHVEALSSVTTNRLEGTARSLSGSVQMSNSTASFTCDWKVVEAGFWTFRYANGWASSSSATRSSGGHDPYSVQLSSGCPVSSTDVLPALLTPYHTDHTRHVMTPWGTWYQGPEAAYRSEVHSSWYGGTSTQWVAVDTLSSATLTWTR